MLRRDKYRITEIAREFQKRGWGDEVALLDFLQEGELNAYVEYPSTDPKLARISKEIWRDLELGDFDVLSKRDRKRGEPLEWSLSGEHFFDQEMEKLKTVAKAAAQCDIGLVHEEISGRLLEELELDNFQVNCF